MSISDDLLIGILATVLVGLAGVVAAVVVYRKQKRQGAIQSRFDENVAANRHNSADVTYTRNPKGEITGSGTSVTPGTGEIDS